MRRSITRFSALVFLTLAFTVLFGMQEASARTLVIYKSKDYICRSYQVQHFQDTLAIEEGQQSLPLIMSIYNGSYEAPSFKWFRIIVNGEVLASEQDMHGKEAASKDVSGLIGGSNLQVQVEAGGAPGANLWWTLSTDQLELRYAQPQQVMPGGEMKLIGSNFPNNPALLSVTMNGVSARVISASNNSLVVQVPTNAGLGVNRVQLRSGAIVSSPISVTVASRPVPEILSIDCWMAPPGGTINISGRNFSPDANSNKVFFGTVEAQVRQASTTELTVVVPNWSYGPNQLNIPISIEVDGMRSANTFPFDIGPMYHGGVPQFGHD